MDSQSLSILNLGKAANVGPVEVQGGQNNNFAPGAKEVRVDGSRKKWVKNIHNNTTYQISNSPSPQYLNTPRYPDYWQDEAKFLQHHCNLPFPSDYRWSVPLGVFTSAKEDAMLSAEIQRRWRQTDKSVRKLNGAVFAFQSSGRREERDDSSGESDDSDERKCDCTPENATEVAVRAELQEAIDFYNRGPMKQSPVLGSLRDISANMNPSLSWVAGLRDDGHRLSVLSTFKCIIVAFKGTDKPDDEVVETVATVVRTFGSDLEDYLSAMRNSRLTTAMETDTIEIFEIIVAIFVPLLNNGRKKLRSPHRRAISENTKRLEEALSSVKNAVKNRQNNRPLDNNLPMTPPPDEFGLVIRLYLSFLWSCRPQNPTASESSPSGRQTRLTRRNSMVQNDTGSFIGVKTLIQYLEYNTAETTNDVDQCLKRAKPNLQDMQKLAALTRRENYLSWLTDVTKHSALLVQGRFRSRSLVSPLSFLCARIASEYSNHDKVVVLSYFCGQCKLEKRRVPIGATDLMCQLIGQLLSHPAVAAAYTQHPVFDCHWEKKIKAKDIKVLIKVFSALIRQLLQPYCELVVFCVIDSINEIETGVLQRDTESVLMGLRDIIQQERKRGRKRKAGDSRMVFKLLVVSPVRSLTAYKFFDGEDTVDLIATGLGSSVAKLNV